MTRQLAHRQAAAIGGVFLAAFLGWIPLAQLSAQDVKQSSRDVAAATRQQSLRGANSFDEPLRLAYKAREKFRTVQDYTCVMIKRERVNGELLPREYLDMKARNRPFSVYFKWKEPYQGREAIYVEAQNKGKLLVHSTGVEKVVGGTVALDPRGKTAMENSRHDVTEAGIGNLVEQLCTRWESEKKLGKTQVEMKDNSKVDNRVCWCVKTLQPHDPSNYSYYRTRVFFDKDNGLPIRFEGYDWPSTGSSPDGDLIEEYTYRDLKFNVALGALDFSVENPKYSFGRF